MKDLDTWRSFLADQFEENPPIEYRTLAGRTLSIDDGITEADFEFSENGTFHRIISYVINKKITKQI